MSKFENAKIYKIVSKNTDKVYVGSTCETLKRRLHKHRNAFKVDSGTTSKHILKFGDYEIVLIENVACENRGQLSTRERFYIESMNCVNKYIPGRSRKEYDQDNALYINEKNKQYRQHNKEAINERNKQYRQHNKEAIKERKNKKYDCECGGKFTDANTARHKKSKKHLKYLESIIQL